MQRRVALKNMAAAVGLISLPTWASGWSQASVASSHLYLSPRQGELLAAIVETIIPATDTPGAKELGVHTFVQKMVADCYEKMVQNNFTKGLATIDALAQHTLNQSFTLLDTMQKISLLQKMEQSDEAAHQEFYALVKGLTIHGYLNSEYVMTNLTHYEMIPSRYHGCVPVPTK